MCEIGLYIICLTICHIYLNSWRLLSCNLFPGDNYLRSVEVFTPNHPAMANPVIHVHVCSTLFTRLLGARSINAWYLQTTLRLQDAQDPHVQV